MKGVIPCPSAIEWSRKSSVWRTLKTALLVSTLLISSCDSADEQAQVAGADRVLTGGRIYTVDDQNPWAEAVAIKGDRFVYVGDDEGAQQYIDDSTVRVDLAGRLVIPGMIDAHTHPGYIDLERYGPELPETSREDILAAVKEYADSHPGEGWIRMCCWPNHLYVNGREGPHKRDLDAIVPDRPVWITSAAWHSSWLNSKGLEVLGVTEDTPDPRPGVAVYARDENGELTGWVKEGAGWQHFRGSVPRRPRAAQEERRSFSRHAERTRCDYSL